MAKKKTSTPRAKRMTRQGRLSAFKHHLSGYSGNNIVRAYRRHFGVDLLCAVQELKMLGVNISPEREKEIRATVENKRLAKQRRKGEEEAAEWGVEGGCDENFAYIAGFTPGGAPFGVTWEEIEAREEAWEDTMDLPMQSDEEEIPF